MVTVPELSSSVPSTDRQCGAASPATHPNHHPMKTAPISPDKSNSSYISEVKRVLRVTLQCQWDLPLHLSFSKQHQAYLPLPCTKVSTRKGISKSECCSEIAARQEGDKPNCCSIACMARGLTCGNQCSGNL